MSEYIEREAKIEELKQWVKNNPHATEESKMKVAYGIQLLANIPAADVEPVVRGELRTNKQGFLECSACGNTLRMPLVSTGEMKRCYICGAYLERSGSGE